MQNEEELQQIMQIWDELSDENKEKAINLASALLSNQAEKCSANHSASSRNC